MVAVQFTTPNRKKGRKKRNESYVITPPQYNGITSYFGPNSPTTCSGKRCQNGHYQTRKPEDIQANVYQRSPNISGKNDEEFLRQDSFQTQWNQNIATKNLVNRDKRVVKLSLGAGRDIILWYTNKSKTISGSGSGMYGQCLSG